MDELFEILDHIELGYSSQVPVILVGRAHWQELLRCLEKAAVHRVGVISPKQLQRMQIVETAKEAFQIIQKRRKRSLVSCHHCILWRGRR